MLPVTALGTSVNAVLDNSKTLAVVAVVGTVGTVTNKAAAMVSETIAVMGLQVQYQGGLLVTWIGMVMLAFIVAAAIVLWLWWVEYAEMGWLLRWLPFLCRPISVPTAQDAGLQGVVAVRMARSRIPTPAVAVTAKERLGAAFAKESHQRA